VSCAVSVKPRATELSRRVFLGLSASAASTLVFGCSTSSSHLLPTKDDAGAADAMADAGMDSAPFGIWEKLRTAVRASPDHLGATADRLVAAKDPSALFEFVRDQIVTYPPTGVDGAVTETRWGVRGTLRGGAGTPREKVELLADLYRRAGFEATIVSAGATDSDPKNSVAKRVYLRPLRRTFAPAVDAATIERWSTEMARVSDPRETAPIDPDDTERAALVASLSALIPGDVAAQMGAYDATLDTASVHDVPLVRVTVDGKAHFANPLFAEARFGESLTDDPPDTAPDAAPAPMVAVELFVSRTSAPTSRLSVAKCSYAADTLAGRQLMVQFAPGVSVETLAKVRMSDVHSFKPVFTLRGADVDPDADPSFVVIGPEITTGGDLLETSPDGTVTLNGRQLFAPSDVDPTAVERVASLSVDVQAGAFPTIQLVVSAKDAKGKPVKGLAASAFRVLENGAATGFMVRATPSANVRVALVFDIDDPLGSGEDPLDFARQLTTAVLAAYPGATIVTTATDGTRVEQTDPDAVAAAVDGADSDDPWSDLATAALQAPLLTVMVSDFVWLGDPADPQNPKGAYRAIVASGPPVVAISTDPAPAKAQAEVARLVALTRGASVPGGGVADSVKTVLDLLAKQHAGETYTLTYQAPSDGPAHRDVTVTSRQQSAAGSYTAPTAAQRVEQSGIAGIYLTVSLGDSSVTRVLAGYPHANPPDPGVPVAAATRDAITAALFGVSLLSFEAAAPSVSTSLDDVLGIKLAVQPLWEAVVAKDSRAIRAAIPGLRAFVPTELMALRAAPSPSTVDSSTYEAGLRIVHYSHQPRSGKGDERRVDILPLAGWNTVSADAKVSFHDTLARTARVAIVEGHTFPTSTLSGLAGKALTMMPPGAVDPAALVRYPADVQFLLTEALDAYTDYFRFLPGDATFRGFWAVSRYTGTLIGVLPDGSGGASAGGVCDQLTDINDAFTVLGLIAGLAGMGMLGPFFWLGKEVAAVALLSAGILDGEDGTVPPSDPNAAINGLAANAACEAAKTAVTTAAGLPGAGLPGALISAIDMSNSINSLTHVANASASCPNALSGVGCK
jgi:hypothetical protein